MRQDDLSGDPEDSEHPPEQRARAGARSTWVSVAVNVGLATIQVLVGIVARSQGLIADGIHSLSDLVADVVVLFAGHHSRKDADVDHPYIHQRFETAASLAALRKALRKVAGAEGERWIRVAAAVNRAVMLSLLLAAVLQGIVVGIGYRLVGIEAPLLLGFATAVASLLPMVGTLQVWGPATLVLLSSGHPLAALSLLAWGTLLVHPLDNILRPLFISSAVNLPFLLVFLGVVGGIAAFGLVGLVIGPVVLSICWSMAREAWRSSEVDSAGAAASATD